PSDALVRFEEHHRKERAAADPHVPATIVDRRDGSHRRLQDEAELERPGRPLEQVAPDPFEDRYRHAMPHHAGDEQHDGEHDDHPAENTQLLRIGIGHRAVSVSMALHRYALTTQRKPIWLIALSIIC